MNKQLLAIAIAAALSASLTNAEIVLREDVQFDLLPTVADDNLAQQLRSSDWDGQLERLLAGYNYAATLNVKGQPQRVVVSGRNGSGQVAAQHLSAHVASAGEELLVYQLLFGDLPNKYRELVPGSVIPIELPIATLQSMKLGEKIALNLPIGAFEIVHDNRFEHENGDVTWVGYVDGAGKGYRVIITSGRDGSLGQIVTPDGVYNIDLENGRNWLVDISSSGLSSGSLDNDQAFGDAHAAADVHARQAAFSGPEPLAANGKTNTKAKAKAKAKTKGKVASARTKSAKPTRTGGAATTSPAQTTVSTIDLMILYTAGLKSADIRLNYLVAKANQAYIDSGIKLTLRVVAKQQVNYTDFNGNDLALQDLTYGRGAFSTVASSRKQFGADLVSIVRPFQYGSQKSCGVAWVNGANGGAFYNSLGYSVISDGIDGGGTRYYCTDFTFAHELGHNMGSVHDQVHSSFAGAYPYSYGHGKPGLFGTVMSYYNPVVGLFSNPNLNCQGEPCGNASSADNARSINQTAPKVANFVQSTR